jgi:hypothetical protein
MSYTITRTNGTVLGTIADGTYDNTHTSLTLVGRNYSNYGQIMTNTLVRLLENSSYNISPSYPLSGQLWWDSGNNYLKVYTGSAWKIVSSCTAQASAPSTITAGDLWWDTANQQLYVYNGTSPYSASGWILIGPGYPVGHQTGAIVETITDTLAATHYVTSLYADGTRIAIISKDSTFTPSPSLTGFGDIQLGMNMASGDTVWGTANNASYLGAQPAANYFRNNQNNTGTGSLTLQTNVGITLGSLSTFNANVNSTDGSGRLYNTFTGGNVSFYVNATSGGTTRGLYVSGADGKAYVGADPTGVLGVASKQYVDNSFINANLWGISTAVTAAAGTSTTQIATTEFVTSGLSGLYPYKIYANAGITHFWVTNLPSPAANLKVGGNHIFLASANGVDFPSVTTAVTQTVTQGNISVASSTDDVKGNTRVATTSYVRQAAEYWSGSAKFVSVNAPAGTDGNNGDFWFQIAS